MRKRTRYSLLLMLALVAALSSRSAAQGGPAGGGAPAAGIRRDRLRQPEAAARWHPLRPHPVTRSPDYQHFIDATGIVPERDLDAVAFALHRMDNPNGPNGPVAYSEVFEGRFDGERLARYLATIATAQENYAGHNIYTIPVGDGKETRPLRIAQLGYDTIAASNMPTTEQIHAMLDRYRAAASPFSGSSLLVGAYRDVPLLSSAWAIGHIGLPFSDRGHISIFGLELPLPEDTTFVASLRYLGALHLRIEQITPTDADAAQRNRDTDNASCGLEVDRADPDADAPEPSSDASFLELMNSAKVEQHRDRAVLTANIPLDLVKRLATPSPEGRP